MKNIWRYKYFPGPYPPPIMLNREVLAMEAQFIKANKLAPVKAGAAELGQMRTFISTSSMLKELEQWWWKFGGRVEPHFHYQGDIYALTKAQWADFSRNLLNIFADKLRAADKVELEDTAEVANVMTGMNVF